VTLAPPASRLLQTTLLALAVALAAAPRAAHADDAPTAEQLAEAKKAYADGKAAFDKGSYGAAVDHFKESYRLSKNPLLLFNIGITFERLGARDMALFYYKKFLTDAPADAAQRPEAEKNIAALESGGTVSSKGDGTAAAPTPAEPVKAKAACVETDVQHQVVEDAPPGKPLDLTAFVPVECNWSVVLFYRGAGEDKFVAATMKPRYNELVGRVPAEKMSGNAVQYYVEVKAADGNLIKRIGKSTSPNVVYLDEAATARFYPDLNDNGELIAGANGGPNALANGDEEDPLAPKKASPRFADDDDAPVRGASSEALGGATPVAGGHGFTDVGSPGFNKAKWISTGIGGTMLVASATFYVMASSWGKSLEGEANVSQSGECEGGPPCRTFTDERADIEATGKRYETFSKITLGVGVVVSGVAGYLWYKERTSKKRSDSTASTTTGLRSIVASPIAGEGFFGGAAALRF